MSGQRLGPYEILGAIAQGGQGAVLRARDPATGAPAAVKVLLRQDERSLRRFKQEAQVLEGLAHPGIVRVLGWGADNGVPWLAMALVEGESLRARIERGGPLDWREAVKLIAALARAVAHAHERGVIHRDLKPENVLLDARTGLPVLVDFGLLRRDAEVFGELSIDAHSRLSRTGELRGTPAYMAPEQASPTRFGPVSPQTDVYGLGGVLGYLLTAEPPRTADSLPNLIYQLLDTDAVVDVAAKRPDVPTEVVREIRRSVARHPEDRHPGAAAFADALDALLDPANAVAAPARSRAGRVVVVVGLALAAAAGLGVALRGRSPEVAATPHVAPGAPIAAAEPPRPLATDAAPRPRPEPGTILLEVAAPGTGTGVRAREARGLWVDDDRFITWGENHGMVRLWSLAQGRAIGERQLTFGIEDVVLGSSELVLLTRAEGLFTLALDLAVDPRRTAAPVDGDARQGPISMSRAPDGRLVLGDVAGRLRALASADDPAPRFLPDPHKAQARAVRFSPDGRWFASGSGRSLEDSTRVIADNRVVLRDGASLGVVAEYELGSQPGALAFSFDGRWLAIGTTGYQLLLADLRDPRAALTELRADDTAGKTGGFIAPTAHGSSIRGLAFLADGRVVSSSGDWSTTTSEASVRFWELPPTSREVRERRVTRTSAALLSLDGRPDGRLVVGDVYGKVLVIAGE